MKQQVVVQILEHAIKVVRFAPRRLDSAYLSAVVERGQRFLLYYDMGKVKVEDLAYAVKLFKWGLTLNPACTLCHQSLGDVLIGFFRR